MLARHGINRLEWRGRTKATVLLEVFAGTGQSEAAGIEIGRQLLHEMMSQLKAKGDRLGDRGARHRTDFRKLLLALRRDGYDFTVEGIVKRIGSSAIGTDEREAEVSVTQDATDTSQTKLRTKRPSRFNRVRKVSNSEPNVLVVATEWDSKNGGLSTFNRNFCRTLADAGVNIFCLVLSSNDAERRRARRAGIRLVDAQQGPGLSDGQRLARKPSIPEQWHPEVVVGHGRITGPAAHTLVADHFPSSKRVHIIHMAPDEIEWHKIDRKYDKGKKAEERTRIEVDLGRTADCVVAVGPKLFRRFQTEFSPFSEVNLVEMVPGFDASSRRKRPPPGEPIRILVLGRMEDWQLKGLDIAARAVGWASKQNSLSATPLELVVRGAEPGVTANIRRMAANWAKSAALRIVVYPYSAALDDITNDIRRASLVLMPSRSEGFGLVGLEAIVAGTPVLVSRESGLGLLVQDTLRSRAPARHCVLEVTGEPIDTEIWGNGVAGILLDRDAAFRRARALQIEMSSSYTWSKAATKFLSQMK
jgi:glycosyltransferase involved in cell wall biosynthesis